MTVAQKMQMWALMVHRLQAIEVGFGGLPARFRLSARAYRPQSHSGRCHHSGAGAGARRSDCPVPSRPSRGRGGPSSTSTTSVNPRPAQICVQTLGAKASRPSPQGRGWVMGVRGPQSGHRVELSSTAGELQQHRGGVCCRGARRRHRRVARRCRPMILNLPATVEVSHPNVCSRIRSSGSADT